METQGVMRMQVHHYHHFDPDSRESFRSSTSPEWLPTYKPDRPDRPELPGDFRIERRMASNHGEARFAVAAAERVPPPVNKKSKPEYVAY
jgi:hypothetical protein